MTSVVVTRCRRVIVALVVLATASLVGSAGALRAAAAPYPPSNPCQVRISPAATAAGGSTRVMGVNMGVGSAVQVSLLPGDVRLASTSADDTGSFSVEVQMPAGLASGSHTVQASSAVASCTAPLRITPEVTSSPTSKPSRTSIPTQSPGGTPTSGTGPPKTSSGTPSPTPAPSRTPSTSGNGVGPTPGPSLGIGSGVSTHRAGPGGAGVAGTATGRSGGSASERGSTVPTAPAPVSSTVVSAPAPPGSTSPAPAHPSSTRSVPPLASEPLLPFGKGTLALIALALAATAACALLLLSVLARRS